MDGKWACDAARKQPGMEQRRKRDEVAGLFLQVPMPSAAHLGAWKQPGYPARALPLAPRPHHFPRMAPFDKVELTFSQATFKQHPSLPQQ